MAEQPAGTERAQLSDLLNYQPEQLLSNEELSLIQGIIGANPSFVQILRKVLLPSVGDSALPIEQLTSDVWLAGRDYAQIPDAEIKSVVLARQDAIKMVMSGLVKLKVIAASAPLSKEAAAAKKEKDSTK